MIETGKKPTLSHFVTVRVDVGEAVDIGETIEGKRRIIPIQGGNAVGDGWRGKVLDLGADFQLYPSSQVTYLKAMYVIEADTGTRLFVTNEAIRAGTPEMLDRLARGENIDPSLIYFRCTPRITAPVDSDFSWVNSRLFVGAGVRHPDHVRLDFFVLD